MEGNGLRGGVFSNLSPGILGLEMPVQQQQQQSQPHHFHPHNMVAFTTTEPDHATQQQPGYPFAGAQRSQKQQQQLMPTSDDEELGMDASDGKRKGSDSTSTPWHRMKWTDAMVRLLIMAVYYIGDECSASEPNNNSSEGLMGKKKGGGAVMQKKGKWKSVSKAMMEKGFYVSPQQCEDKFNDLNKRYKRVNEILGKGTACRVVENQSLLDQMDHLSTKSKEEVRKLLNSKHLFFREMCAYHNSCGGAGAGVPHHSPSPRNPSVQKDGGNQSEDEEDSEEHEEEEEDSEAEGMMTMMMSSMKRRREEETTSLERLREMVEGVMEDGRRSGREKREWVRMRMVRVEEEKVGQEMEAYEIEKERLKWAKYSGKKEREMERRRLRNERGKLECERMVLLLKQKEMEMEMAVAGSTSSKIRPDPSSVTG